VLQEKKGVPEPVVRSAEQPGQTINVDLCFVPQEHTDQDKLPAVSGSSGHLVIERIRPPDEKPYWPGQIFGEADLPYTEAMQQYVQATQDRQIHSHVSKAIRVEEPTLWRQEWEGRAQRYQIRQRRLQEDADWKAAKANHRQAGCAHQQFPKRERKLQNETWHVEQAAWQKIRAQRRAQELVRQQENQTWHQRNRQLKDGVLADSQGRSWIAILVISDNCTRQCLGLPVFRTGAKVTSQEVIGALEFILPPELQFLISDQGKHFRTKLMDQLADEEDFVYVPIYRHRPQTNGIAERFVLTLKDWLRSQSWQSAEKLEWLVQQFLVEYNDRPHQGLAIPGLSPNEFAKRIWLI
jgi:hypothetical protein